MESPKPTLLETITSSFERQTFLKLIGAVLLKVEEGEVRIGLPFRADLSQQAGFIHAAPISGIVDSACGYAAKTLMPPQSEVLTVEYKMNFLRPARGERFEAVGRVLKACKTLTVCMGKCFQSAGRRPNRSRSCKRP